MLEPKLITIFGGTGSQGGGLARSLLLNKDNAFKVRVITRDPTSAKAQGFARLGAELVKADGWNKEEVRKAFEGSWGAFVNTNSNDDAVNIPGAPNDYDLGALVVDAAEEAGVKHCIYSGGPSVCLQTHGRIFIPGFETKYAVDQKGRAMKFTSWITIVPGYFMENFNDPHFTEPLGGIPWLKQEDSTYLVTAPRYGGKEDVPWISIEDDFGDILHGIFLNPEKYNRTVIQGISQILSFPGLAAIFEEVTGVKCRYEEMASWTTIPTDGSMCRDDLRYMFCYTQDTGGRYFGDVDTDITIPQELKKAAKEAQVLSHDSALTTAKFWLARELKRKCGA